MSLPSPKRSSQRSGGWADFFPYYAGFSEVFAYHVLSNADIDPGSRVLDPWNGSGTTTYAAYQLGYHSVGVDLNPVMIITARARLIAASESDSLLPLAQLLISHARSKSVEVLSDDPLFSLFDERSAITLRTLEQGILNSLVGHQTVSADGVDLSHISPIAACFYLAIFNVSRNASKNLVSSNPTWTRKPREGSELASADDEELYQDFLAFVAKLSKSLALSTNVDSFGVSVCVKQGNSVDFLDNEKYDVVLTSPPYCTRLDYISATRVELAVIASFVPFAEQHLSRQMLGSIKVPLEVIDSNPKWGNTCLDFLDKVRSHPSKASDGYYYKTHMDYFDKLYRSIQCISSNLKNNGQAIFVVQDSYYKEIHNDISQVLAEMAQYSGLTLREKADFESSRSMASRNAHSKRYRTGSRPRESVLRLKKI